MVQEQAELSVCAVRGTHMVILIIPLGKSFKECSPPQKKKNAPV